MIGGALITPTHIIKKVLSLMIFTHLLSTNLRLVHSFQFQQHQRVLLSSSSSFIINRNGILKKMSSSAETEEADYNDIILNLKEVQTRINNQIQKSNREENDVRLVAVSKTKPIDMIKVAYTKASQRHFGENYVQELISKATQLKDEENGTYNDIQWHYIGPLQSNKAANLVKSTYPNLYVIETVSTIKIATKLNRAMEDIVGGKDDDDKNEKLNIFIQINTSNEESKSGLSSTNKEEIYNFIKEIQSSCSYLNVLGLMTIGYAGSTDDFKILNDIKDYLVKDKGVESIKELSMGMSNDFEDAIEYGSTNIRVGSTIFGARDYSN